MMRPYRKKPVTIFAEQWFKVGDVPEAPIYAPTDPKIPISPMTILPVGKCEKCSIKIDKHGVVATLEGLQLVCPGDFIVKGVAGEFYPVKPGIFRETYEVVNSKDG